MTDDKTLNLLTLKTVLFPGMLLVHEAEDEEVRLALQRCFEEEGPLGVVANVGGTLRKVGCTAQIEQVLQDESEPGRLQFILKGGVRFRILEWVKKEGMPVVRYEEVSDTSSRSDAEAMKELQDRVLASYKKIVLVVKPEKFTQVANADGQIGMSFPLAATTVFDAGVKQQILEEDSESRRLSMLADYYKQILPRISALGGNGFLFRDGH